MTLMNIVVLAVNCIITTVLGILINKFANKLDKIKKEEEAEKEEINAKNRAIEEGLVALLRNELVRRYREYETVGEISILDKENFEDMFEQYENLGGNGTMKKMAKDVLNLPIKIIK